MHGSRRKFVKAGLVAITLPTLGLDAAGTEVAVHSPPAQQWKFLTTQEAVFLTAACDRLIPPDAHWPGASAAGVVTFIDEQMAGPWGRGELINRSRPFQRGIPTQGYQLAYTPAELLRHSIAAIHQHAVSFERLSHAEQDAFLTKLEHGSLDLNGVPSATFFEAILKLTQEGFFADPMYGGNRDMVAWRMIGFPGAYSSYYDVVDQHGMLFDRPPLSIQSAGELSRARPMAIGD